MTLINWLRKAKEELLKTNIVINETKEEIIKINESDIQIVIEDYKNLFENEIEIIKNGALILLENGDVDNLEEGIIVFATMFRGLKYKNTEKEENGKTKIILRDVKSNG